MSGSDGDLLVLGASGRLGRLLRAVWACDVPARWHARRPTPGFHACDILNDTGRLRSLAEGASTILCLAGTTDRTVGMGRAAYADNVRLACAAVDAAARAGCSRVFLASSAAVYGSAGGPLHEDSPGRDLSPYGQSKRDMEREAWLLAQSAGVALCSLRIGNVAGSDAILGDWQPGFRLDRFADGSTPRRSYIGPVSLARAVAALLAANAVPARVNIAAPGIVSMGALLDAAGLAWKARPAPANALPEVSLSTELLSRFWNAPLHAGGATALVAEWHGTLHVRAGA